MPIFMDQFLLGYRVSMRPKDRFRKIIHYIFHYDILPYMYGSTPILELKISAKDNDDIDKLIQYEWYLESVDNKIKFSPRRSDANLLHGKSYKSQLSTDLITVPTQYQIRVQIIDSRTKSGYKTVGLLTVNDRDKFYETFFWLLVGAIITIYWRCYRILDWHCFWTR